MPQIQLDSLIYAGRWGQLTKELLRDTQEICFSPIIYSWINYMTKKIGNIFYQIFFFSILSNILGI